MSNSNNSGGSFGFIALILFVAILYGIYSSNQLEKTRENAADFCKNMPIECNCKVGAKISGFGKYARKSYYVTYKQNGQSAIKEF